VLHLISFSHAFSFVLWIYGAEVSEGRWRSRHSPCHHSPAALHVSWAAIPPATPVAACFATEKAPTCVLLQAVDPSGWYFQGLILFCYVDEGYPVEREVISERGSHAHGVRDGPSAAPARRAGNSRQTQPEKRAKTCSSAMKVCYVWKINGAVDTWWCCSRAGWHRDWLLHKALRLQGPSSCALGKPPPPPIFCSFTLQTRQQPLSLDRGKLWYRVEREKLLYSSFLLLQMWGCKVRFQHEPWGRRCTDEAEMPPPHGTTLPWHWGHLSGALLPEDDGFGAVLHHPRQPAWRMVSVCPGEGWARWLQGAQLGATQGRPSA